MSGAPHIFDGKHVLVTSLFVWLTVNSTCAHDVFFLCGAVLVCHNCLIAYVRTTNLCATKKIHSKL